MLFLPVILIFYFIYFFRESFLRYSPIAPIIDNNKQPRYVLISGCDTGFGYLLAKELDKKGWYVIALCLHESSAKTLSSESSNRLSTMVCDIANESNVDRAFEDIIKITSENGKRKPSLYALVNNAGIGEGARFDWTPLSLYHRVMSVNFLGHVNVLKHAQPLLLENAIAHQFKFGCSRVINVTSVAGLMGVAGMSAYAASKFAFEGFSEAFRKEQHDFGISVSTVNPAFMSTEIVNNSHRAFQATWDNTPAEMKKNYGDEYFNELSRGLAQIQATAENPMKCVHSLIHAIESPRPYARYLPGWQGKIMFLLTYLPSFIVDPLIRQANRAVPALRTQVNASKKDA